MTGVATEAVRVKLPVLTLVPGDTLSLVASGPTAPAAGADHDNLVLRAARALREQLPRIFREE